ncbi:MAG: prepilin-type N-terminal cleavage/methylation domain-containing protein [Parcubacteria group bacterium]|nr:prepilin-type N-terminal cleavage/methylation domain-containing protein [Parcubacteria group bacterium]MBI2049033.1 prepilin-type N-terminal cleavage/methylation domain-containing protein [Parcubacteria group bacterium]
MEIKNWKLKIARSAGFGLIEILIAIAIIGVALTTLSGVILSAFRVTDDDVSRVQAEFLAGEGLEVARLLRDTGWEANIALLVKGTLYYPIFDSVAGVWAVAESAPAPIDGTFSRVLVFENAYRRDSDDDIVPQSDPISKTLDTGTVGVVSRVSWRGRTGDSVVEKKTYLMDLFGN